MYCLKPANKEAAPDTETDRERWAPPVQVRGDIARSLMYMAVCYGFQQPGGIPNLQLSDSPSIENREMGLLSALLKWNEIDPPSREERLRNDRICRLYQHNRNPFVDHPEYANLIWNHIDKINRPASHTNVKAWVNEFHYNNKGKDCNEFVEIIASSSTDASRLRLVLYNGANGKMYKKLSLADEIFNVRNLGAGFSIYTAYLPLQNGPRDSMALVSVNGGDVVEVVQFLSYEGTVKACDGPAMDIESVDVKVYETEESSELDSLGLTGEEIGGFEWTKFIGRATPGRPNAGQRFVAT
ncbi:hypothetical protein QJS10_CPB17g00030 [Acorus calamus]|uniref:Uncharacterized protein n=1 Tax=Acorus calamus TaxID=4465 RepID=A0AAV9CYI9_ACOCL|nr:hypothetical protein QJS10_CPB17g00030 [Acorus calamus]